MATDANALSETRTKFASKRTDLADERTREALVRTHLAQERTMMAWVRTATSLISFGFTIYKFFQYLRESPGWQGSGDGRWLDARAVALAMIGLGVGALLVATVEHRRASKELHALYGDFGTLPRSLAAGVAMVLTTIGLVGLVLVFFHQ